MAFPSLSNAVKSSVLGWGMSVVVMSNFMSSTRGAKVSRRTLSVPCPFPVFASEPYRTASYLPADGNSFINILAADSGPMVCELDGPRPIL